MQVYNLVGQINQVIRTHCFFNIHHNLFKICHVSLQLLTFCDFFVQNYQFCQFFSRFLHNFLLSVTFFFLQTFAHLFYNFQIFDYLCFLDWIFDHFFSLVHNLSRFISQLPNCFICLQTKFQLRVAQISHRRVYLILNSLICRRFYPLILLQHLHRLVSFR